jgi:hypothetical protein
VQKLAEICIQRPIFASMLVLSLVVVGAAGYFNLGRGSLPGGGPTHGDGAHHAARRAPEDVESEIADLIEGAVNTVEGINELRSVSFSGASFVVATFNLERDIDTATQDVRDRVQGVLNKLPLGTDPPTISKMNNESTPVLTVALSADRSIRELTELANQLVRPQLERASGVGEVLVVGGQERAIKVWLHADKLRAFGIPITLVRDAITKQNANLPAGNVTTQEREETLRTMGRMLDPREFEQLVVARINGAPVRLSDLGYTEDGTYEQRSIARLDGVPTVVLEVRRQSGANTIATIAAAKESLERIKAQLPNDVRVELVRDQSRYIYAALHEINTHLILGAILASLVVLLFMRSARSTLIASVAIPASVVSTFAMMWLLDFTLNSVTMLALVLMVGIVIDDAIVVLENIFRFVEEKQMDAAPRPGGDAGDRPGRARHHAVPGGDLPAGLVHVLDLGALPVSVRHHRRGRDHGQPVRVVLADADDERAAALGQRGPCRRRRGGLARRLLRAPRSPVCEQPRLRHAAPAGGGAVRPGRDAVGHPALQAGQAGVRAQRRRRGGVRAPGHRAPEREHRRDGSGDAPAAAGPAPGARRAHGAAPGGRWLQTPRSTAARASCASRPTRSACSR